MTEIGSHWSKPGALAFLRWMVARGGTATGMEIADAMQTTGARDFANDARCYVQAEHGFTREQAAEAVRCECAGANAHGRKVMRYTLSPALIHLYRRTIAGGCRPPVELGRQAALFDNSSRALEDARRR